MSEERVILIADCTQRRFLPSTTREQALEILLQFDKLQQRIQTAKESELSESQLEEVAASITEICEHLEFKLSLHPLEVLSGELSFDLKIAPAPDS